MFFGYYYYCNPVFTNVHMHNLMLKTSPGEGLGPVLVATSELGASLSVSYSLGPSAPQALNIFRIHRFVVQDYHKYNCNQYGCSYYPLFVCMKANVLEFQLVDTSENN